MRSYLFMLTTRGGNEVFALREIPPRFRVAAAGLPIGGKMDVPAGTLMSLDAGRDIPPMDFAALCEAEI